MEKPGFIDPPKNPKGGKTLVVDNSHSADFTLPSNALKEAGEDDLVFVRPGIYEDKIFVADRPVQLIGAGRDVVEIFCRRGGPLNLQNIPEGQVKGLTFRYVGSDPYSAMNLLDTTCHVTECRAKEGIQSGILVYGPESRATLIDNEVCGNRESGIFVFAGARPYIRKNTCTGNHHFGIAVRDAETRPDLVRNTCHHNMLSGILLFYFAEAMMLDNKCYDNAQWGLVVTPDCKISPPLDVLSDSNELSQNPRGAWLETHEPLRAIGR